MASARSWPQSPAPDGPRLWWSGCGPLAGAGIGWWALVPARQPGPSAFALLRFVRETINSFFPVAVIGGDVIGARLLTGFGVVINLAVASAF